MRVLRILARILFVVAVLIGALFLSARFMDGPLGAIPGGPLESGVLEPEAVEDWRFASELDTIEMQLISDERSRTVWILVHEGRAFIPCAIGAPPGKTWHLRALEDGRSLIRLQGKRYPITLTRIETPELRATLEIVMSEKYPGPPGAGGEGWYFGIESRPLPTANS